MAFGTKTTLEKELSEFSFSLEIKKELINIESDKCCIQAELAALIRMNSELSIGKNTLTLDIQTENVAIARRIRSEEHTSELQSRFDLVCRLLLEKKKK